MVQPVDGAGEEQSVGLLAMAGIRDGPSSLAVFWRLSRAKAVVSRVPCLEYIEESSR